MRLASASAALMAAALSVEASERPKSAAFTIAGWQPALPGRGGATSKGGQPVALEAHFFSNEKRKVAKFIVPSDGAWHTFSEAMEIDFDLAVTDLAALQFKVSAPADELCFKDLTLAKVTK